MADPRPIRHTLVVPKGYESRPEVLQALGRLQTRFGKDNVDLIIEEGARDADSGGEIDRANRRVHRLPPDQD